MELFHTAMKDATVEAAAVTERGMSGARGLPDLLHRLNPS